MSYDDDLHDRKILTGLAVFILSLMGLGALAYALGLKEGRACVR